MTIDDIEDDDSRAIGARIRARREAMELSLADFAAGMRLDVEACALIEATGRLSARQLQAAARALDVPPHELLDADGPDARVEQSLIVQSYFRRIDDPALRHAALTLLGQLAAARR